MALRASQFAINSDRRSFEDAVQRGLEAVRPLLPAQGPLTTFIAANTLEGFQREPFHEAVRSAQAKLGGEPYLSEAEFRNSLATGRIDESDLRVALREEFADGEWLIEGVLNEFDLRLLTLAHEIHTESEATLKWLIAERGVTTRLRSDVSAGARDRLLDETRIWLDRKYGGAPGRLDLEASATSALWSACCDLLGQCAPIDIAGSSKRGELHRDAALRETEEDIYDTVLPIVIRLCAAFLDEGIAHKSMPGREQGFYGAVRNMVAHGSFSPDRAARLARGLFSEQLTRGDSALDAVCDSLQELGVRPDHVACYLERLLLTLPGWAGMMSRLEQHPEDRPADGPPCSLLDFLAVRMTYERAALRDIVDTHFDGKRKLSELTAIQRGVPRAKHASTKVAQAPAYRLFQVAQLIGLSVPRVESLYPGDATRIIALMDRFDQCARRRIFQEAYERHFRIEQLAAIAANQPMSRADCAAARPKLQFITCFDDREESLRRHLEEVETECETYGAPGFFGAAIRFRSLDQVLHEKLAPGPLQPVHHVDEQPWTSDVGKHRSRQRRRRWWGVLQQQFKVGNRSLARGFLLNVALGAAALLPLAARTLSPRLAGKLSRFVGSLLLPMPRTNLLLHWDTPGDRPMRRFLVEERVSRVATVLENIGIGDRFARLVVVLGHGATTLNNPHFAAYECGACGGRKGGANARVFARMANDARVREGMRALGIHIPDDVVFVGGEHDTCTDGVQLFDTESVPESHRADLNEALRVVNIARARNAEERCRRLVPFSGPKNPSPKQALRHVESRAEHLAQPRPELSHQANAAAIVGRRRVTRGLFLDRRAFLLSYDASLDPEGTILERSLAAAVPVGVGINLQYYFSRVDNETYGSGSKLPQNVVGLVGVMSGHSSDLRTGLPQQMVDVHEPQRLLVVVEATPERLSWILSRQDEIRTLVTNRWLRLVSLHPETGVLAMFGDRGFEPCNLDFTTLPAVSSSREYFRGRHASLPPARVDAKTGVARG